MKLLINTPFILYLKISSVPLLGAVCGCKIKIVANDRKDELDATRIYLMGDKTMGKYDHVFDSEETIDAQLTSEEAVMAIAMVASFVDDDAADVEGDAFAGIMTVLPTFERYSEDDFSAMQDKIINLLEEGGLGALFNAAMESLTEDHVPTAFAAAVAMIMIDGEVPDEEAEFANELQQALGLSDKEAEQIIDGVAQGMAEADAEDEEYEEEEEEYQEV